MTQPAPFRERTVLALVAAGGLSLLLAIGFAILGDELTPPPHPGSHGFSRAAVGHRALLELLRRLDVPVVSSQHDTLARARSSAVVVVAEPRLRLYDDDADTRVDARREELAAMIQHAENLLIVLPKWEGTPDASRPAWISDARLVAESEVNEILALVDPDARVERVSETPVPPYTPPEDYPPPTLSTPRQLVRSSALVPHLWSSLDSDTGGGILLGELETDFGRLWILSDPDVLSNHGLDDGDNAAFIVHVLHRLRDGEGAVIFDETLHGFEHEPSVWRALLEMPLVLATASVLLAVAVLLWAATGRFGPAVPYTGGLAAGKRPLIDNIAALLEVGGHGRELLRGYLVHATRDVARRLHAPGGLDPAGQVAWLDAVAGTRGVRLRLADLEREADRKVPRRQATRHALRVARNLHRWKREMLG